MQLFYNPNTKETTQEVAFDKEESRHIVKVLRKSEGDLLEITNGNGWLFKASIIQADIKKCVASIIEKEKKAEKNYRIHLAVAPTKLNDRYEWFLEKSTELGIDEITPIICDHSERKTIKLERYNKIIQSAMKQSLQTYLPKLNEQISFKNFLSNKINGQRFIAHCDEGKKLSLKQELAPNQDVTILIGPEGDFSVKEIEMALKTNFIPVTLGETRLRTETAAIVACHSVVFKNE